MRAGGGVFVWLTDRSQSAQKVAGMQALDTYLMSERMNDPATGSLRKEAASEPALEEEPQ